MLPFFKDERYITVDGRPLFVLYRPEIVGCLNEMLDYWNKLAKENGFENGFCFAYELLFSKPFMLTEVNGAYTVRRCLLESVVGGSDYFSTEGVVVRASMPDGQIAIQNRVNFEGWRHDRSSDDDNLAITDGEETIIYERGADYQT